MNSLVFFSFDIGPKDMSKFGIGFGFGPNQKKWFQLLISTSVISYVPFVGFQSMVILIILCFVTKIIENSHGKKKNREIGKGNKIVLPKGRKQDLFVKIIHLKRRKEQLPCSNSVLGERHSLIKFLHLQSLKLLIRKLLIGYGNP